METAVALALFASLLIAGWVAYVRTGARRWTTERDPLGEPPVRLAAAVGALVLVVALISTGGGGAEHPGSTQQGLEDGESAFAASDSGAGSAAGGTAAANVVAAASSGSGKATGRSGDGRTADASETVGTSTASGDSALDASRYAELVDRAHDAAERRGATVTWYPAIVRKAERASARRGR